jgi:Arc/MetJ-type ribon-helix-helix transcriptional regulator
MTIHLKPDQEHRIAEAVRSGAYGSPDEVIDRALEVLHEHDEWLTANRHAIDAKIHRGIEELDRGEGIPEDELDAHLERLKLSRNDASLDPGAGGGARSGCDLALHKERKQRRNRG